MGKRYTLLYRFSTDAGLTWTDFTDQVDSRQTQISFNLCTNNFTSAIDTASVYLPETPLFEADGVTPTPKKLLIDAILSSDNVLVEIDGPGAVNVLWNNNLVLWDDKEVLWRNSVKWFTGYIDKSSIDLKSYPLPPALTLTIKDVSFIGLDEKVDRHIYLQSKTITQIVQTLLGYAGYSYDSSQIKSAEEITLEAFVIDKENANSYRSYIDTLLFEAGGYVLNFTREGIAQIVRLPWDSATTDRLIDNPMNDNGLTIKAAILKEDGARLKWSTLTWSSADQVLWRDSISRSVSDTGKVLQGQKIENGRYWPDGGEITPTFMEYKAENLDTPYLTRESRKQNKDLSIIAVDPTTVTAYIQATYNNAPFTGFAYDIPVGDDFDQFSSNPTIYPKKAWYLLHNTSGHDVDLQFFSLRGKALYRNAVNTKETTGTLNPKEYTSTYIYTSAHAEQFLKFYWHFLSTSRYQMSWSEPNRNDSLGTVVELGPKGYGATQKALVVGTSFRFINDNTSVTSFNAVGLSDFVSQSMDSYGDNPAGNNSDLVAPESNPADMNYRLEYSVSTSDVSYTPADGAIWGVSYKWYRGLFVWQRLVVIDKDGAETAGPPSYSRELTDSLENGSRFRILPSSPTWDKNFASTQTTTVEFDIDMSNFKTTAAAIASIILLTITPFKNGVAQTPVSLMPVASLSASYSFPTRSDWDSIEITAKISLPLYSTVANREYTTTASISAIDVTVYNAYAGRFATDAEAETQLLADHAGIMDGYSYTNTSNNLIRVYDSTQGGWINFNLLITNPNVNKSAVLTHAERDLWEVLYPSMTAQQKQDAFDLYGYKRNIISEVIAAAELIMYGDGVISSNGVSSADVDSDGYLTKQGYRFEGRLGILRAFAAYIADSYAKNLTIDEDSVFKGSIVSSVFKTILSQVPAGPFTAKTVGGVTIPNGALGSEIKTNLAAWASAKLSLSDATHANFYAASGTLANGKSFSKVIFFGTLPNYGEVFDSIAEIDYETDETLTWTNPYPFPVDVRFSYSNKYVEVEGTVTTGDWEFQYSSSFGSYYPPEELQERLGPKPDNPSVGDTWREAVLDSYDSQHNYYYYTLNTYEYTETSTTETWTNEGFIQGDNDGTTFWPNNWDSYTVQPGKTITVTLYGATYDPDTETPTGNESAGSLDIIWNPASYFKSGLNFFNNSNVRQFALSDITGNVITSPVTLTVTIGGVGNQAVNLDIGSSSTFSFTSSYGPIYPLYSFRWSSAPSGSGLWTQLANTTSVSVTQQNGSAMGGLSPANSANYTTTSLTINNIALNGYYRAYDISMVPIAKNPGIEGMDFLPMTTDTYHCGTSYYQWLEGHFKRIYSDNVQITSALEKKKDVREYKGSAMKLLEDTKIVSFKYKADEKGSKHIGFVADNTPAELASENHDALMVGDCIGVLIKATQELNERLKKLEDR